MRRNLAFLLCLVVAGCTGAVGADSPSTSPSSVAPPSTGSTASASIDASSLVDIGAGLHGPAGLTATVYATGVTNAAAFAFDAEGRLWVATAAFSDDGSDAISVVASAGATPEAVVTDVHTPLGLLWNDGTLYVASAKRVEAYSGYADGAFASHRTVLALPEIVGEVNGMALAPDGRLALGVSAPCDACEPATNDAAAVLSFLPDGSDLQVVASGIRAPVGLAYVPGTDDLLVTMNQRDDLGDATPGDWLALVRAGQEWGFPDCYGQGGPACAGVPDPIAVLDPHAAVSGVAVVTGQLGPEIGRSAIVAEWATGRVLRVALATTSDGTTSDGTVELFLLGVSKPVGVAVAPDGSIIVGDWASGTIYRIAKA
jgi:glucose/arabinose dehydrogenase